MMVDELKEEVKAVLATKYSAQVYFVLKKDDSLVLRLADIEDDKAAPKIKEMYTEYLNDSVVNNVDLQICDLSKFDERGNTICFYDYDTYPEELGLFNDFDIRKAVGAEKFNFNTDDLNCLYGYIIYLGTMESGIILFKKHYPIFLIKRDSFLLGAVKDAKRFEMISGEDIIRFYGNAQLLRIKEKIYVIDVKMLERNMGFTALLQKQAEESLSSIEALGILDDIEVLNDSLDNMTFCRKIAKSTKSSPIFELEIPTAVIVDFTKNTPQLAGKFKYDDSGLKIRLDTKKSKDEFIKLMNDSFLHSELTKQYYDALSKDKIQ